jgi:predicted DNA-binding transcriptional regulator AlpA
LETLLRLRATAAIMVHCKALIYRITMRGSFPRSWFRLQKTSIWPSSRMSREDEPTMI